MASSEVIERRVYSAGEIVFKEGEVSRRCAYLVEKGHVEICKKSPEGMDVQLGIITAGGIFGEMALVDNKPRMAMARAMDACTLIIITETILEQKLRKADPFIRGLLNMFVRNLREMAEKVVNAPSGH